MSSANEVSVSDLLSNRGDRDWITEARRIGDVIVSPDEGAVWVITPHGQAKARRGESIIRVPTGELWVKED